MQTPTSIATARTSMVKLLTNINNNDDDLSGAIIIGRTVCTSSNNNDDDLRGAIVIDDNDDDLSGAVIIKGKRT